jgi:Lon protease-like protein
MHRFHSWNISAAQLPRCQRLFSHMHILCPHFQQFPAQLPLRCRFTLPTFFHESQITNRESRLTTPVVSCLMGPMRPDRIPLFPLNVVLLPGADLPLHIFEPRYRQMVRRCVEDGAEFGMLLALPKGIVRVGCTAEVVEVAKRYSDGRMDILTIGRAPFRIVELLNAEQYTEDGLLEGYVDYLDDRERPVDSQIQRQVIELYEICHTLIFEDYPRNINDERLETLSYLIAETLPMELLWKQQLLELRCEADRQERLLSYLRDWAPHLQNRDAKRASAGGNGHGCN